MNMRQRDRPTARDDRPTAAGRFQFGLRSLLILMLLAR